MWLRHRQCMGAFRWVKGVSWAWPGSFSLTCGHCSQQSEKLQTRAIRAPISWRRRPGGICKMSRLRPSSLPPQRRPLGTHSPRTKTWVKFTWRGTLGDWGQCQRAGTWRRGPTGHMGLRFHVSSCMPPRRRRRRLPTRQSQWMFHAWRTMSSLDSFWWGFFSPCF